MEDKTVIAMRETDLGVELSVRAQPGAKRNAIVGEHDQMLKVAVTQVAENGKANDAIILLLAKQFRLAKSRITLLAGATNRQKRFLIVGVTQAELQESLAELLGSSES